MYHFGSLQFSHTIRLDRYRCMQHAFELHNLVHLCASLGIYIKFAYIHHINPFDKYNRNKNCDICQLINIYFSTSADPRMTGKLLAVAHSHDSLQNFSRHIRAPRRVPAGNVSVIFDNLLPSKHCNLFQFPAFLTFSMILLLTL